MTALAGERKPSSHRHRFHDPVAASYDAVVVGAGLGGLVTAALLARAGNRVLAIDGHYVAGGNATVFRRKDYEFDVGIHYLGDCGPDGIIPKILDACGAGGIRFRPMDADLEQITFPDFDFAIPRDKAEFRARLLTRFPDQEAGITRYFRFLDQIDRLQRANLSGSRWQQLKAAARCPLGVRYMNRTFGEFLDSCTKNPQLRAILTAQNGTYAIAPGRVSAVLHAGLQNHYFTSGGWYPEGGGQVMADRLAEAIEARGGHIRLVARASRIHVEDGRVTGVTFNSKHLGTVRVSAPLVISNADLKRTVLELVGAEHFPDEYVERVQHFEMALPLFVVFLGLDVPVTQLPYGNANRWVFSDYDFDGEYERVGQGEFPERPFVYIATASHKDPDNKKLAPAGHTNMEVMTIAPPQPEAWGVTAEQLRDGTYVASEGYKFAKEQMIARVIAQAEKAIPGLSQHIAFREAATPLTHTRYTGSTGGTSYGIAATPTQFLQRRPGASTPIEGLFLAGASTRSGHGIIGAMLSGVYAAQAILRNDAVARILAR
jgi:phytoene dehydrogenase-like protein